MDSKIKIKKKKTNVSSKKWNIIYEIERIMKKGKTHKYFGIIITVSCVEHHISVLYIYIRIIIICR